jgi:hypothetical protein
MAKSFITGAARGVTDSVKRVTEMMKGRPDPHAERQAAAAKRRDTSDQTAPQTPRAGKKD